MAGKQRIAAVHGRAADNVFNKVGVDVDAAIVEEQAEALLSLQHVGHGLAKVGLAQDPRSLGLQPVEELIDQRSGQFQAHGDAMIWVRATDGILDLVECCDAPPQMVITDFEQGLDQIDLSALALSFVGTAAFSGTGAAELRYVTGTDRLVIDIDGDGSGDYRIQLSSGVENLASDLIL